MDSRVSDRNKPFYRISNFLKCIIFGNLITIKKVEEISQQLDSVQKAQARTRGQIEELKRVKGGLENDYHY